MVLKNFKVLRPEPYNLTAQYLPTEARNQKPHWGNRITADGLEKVPDRSRSIAIIFSSTQNFCKWVEENLCDILNKAKNFWISIV
jgi:hypothetical protein